jgi:hypothetical protein
VNNQIGITAMEARVQLANLLGKKPTPRQPLNIEALDAALGGGVPLAGVIEIVSEPGHGGWWFAALILSQLLKPVGILNHDDTLHPPGLARLDVDMSRALVVHTKSRRDAVWALERMAKNPDLGATVCWMHGLTDVQQRRLQLAAERSGQCVLMLHSEAHTGRASWGALRVKIEGRPSAEEGFRRLCVTPLRGRGGVVPTPIEIEVEHGTNAVRDASVVPQRTYHAEPRATGA